VCLLLWKPQVLQSSVVRFMLPIPFYKPSIGEEEINEVVDTLRGGWLTTGPKVKQFEAEFSQYLGHRHSVAVNSCTAALHLALEAIGLKAGQFVVVPTMTFAATAEAVALIGATPVFVDVQAETFNIDAESLKRAIATAKQSGLKPKAVIPPKSICTQLTIGIIFPTTP